MLILIRMVRIGNITEDPYHEELTIYYFDRDGAETPHKTCYKTYTVSFFSKFFLLILYF